MPVEIRKMVIKAVVVDKAEKKYRDLVKRKEANLLHPTEKQQIIEETVHQVMEILDRIKNR